MSFQAVTWAIEQRAGGPSAKAVLWSIANYANEAWCSWPSQRTIGEESEQSPDAVQRRIPELEAAGLVRRIPLQFQGRRSVDFFILQPSRFFEASLEEIEPLLPRGYSVTRSYAAASSGSVSTAEVPVNRGVPGPDAAANAAANAAALERQQEPLNPVLDVVDGCARARPMISAEAHEIATEIATIAGHDPGFLPPRWISDGPAMRVQMMLDTGWQRTMMIETARSVMGAKRDGPPGTIKYFEKPFAAAHARQSQPSNLPTVETAGSANGQHRSSHQPDSWQGRRDQQHQAFADLRAANRARSERAGADGDGAAVRMVPHAGRG